MDGQRQYPTEPDRWYTDRDHPDDSPGRAPGQRGDGRYTDDPRYDDPPHRYAALTEDSRHTPVVDRRDYGGYPEPSYEDREQGRRRAEASGRSTRVGKRSGLELPDYDMPDRDLSDDDALDRDMSGWDGGGREPGRGADEPPRFHTEVLDRGALRRPNAPGIGGVAGDPAGPPMAYPAMHGPTQTMPSGGGQAASVVYRPRRPGVAALLAFAGVVVEMLLIRVLLSGEFASTVGGRNVLGGLFAMAGVPMVIFGLYGLATGAATAGGPSIGRAWLRTPLAYLPIGLILIIAAGLAI